jgi:hypothetical protein
MSRRHKRKLTKGAIRKMQEMRRLVEEWKLKRRAQKMGFGAPNADRRPAKTVTSGWITPVSGGGIETNRSRH